MALMVAAVLLSRPEALSASAAPGGRIFCFGCLGHVSSPGIADTLVVLAIGAALGWWLAGSEGGSP